MNGTEEALTAAFDAAAETIRPDTLRPLPSVAGRTRYRRKGKQSGSRRGWLAPMAAAVAVTLVAVLTVTLTSSQHSTSSGPALAGVQAAMPQFFTEMDRASLQVRSVATGKLIGQVPASEMNRTGIYEVTAAPGGRMFYLIGYLPQTPGRPVIYSISVTSAGTITPLRLVARGPATSLGDGGPQNIAVSPDGTELAFATDTGSASAHLVPTIVVVDLRTGRYHQWLGGLPASRKGIGLSIWDLSWSGTRTLDFVASWCANQEWLYCGSGSAQVRALSVGPDGGGLAGSTMLTGLGRFPDVVGVVADQQGHLAIMQVSPREVQGTRVQVTIDQVAATGGAVLRVLYQHSYPSNPNQVGPMLGDPSGQYLMVWVFEITSGWLHDGTLHRLPANRPYPYPQGFAW